MACDMRQLSPEWHFDSAPNPDTIVALWNRGCRRVIDKTLTFCRPVRGRPEHPRLALLGFGAVTHAIADFYAHTNWIELHLSEHVVPISRVPVAQLYALECNAGQFPSLLESGYFHLRHGVSGCPHRNGKFCPPNGCSYAHAEIAKDFPRQGHGADPVPGGDATYFDAAVQLAVAATVEAWQSLHALLLDRYGAVANEVTDWFQTFSFRPGS